MTKAILMALALTTAGVAQAEATTAENGSLFYYAPATGTHNVEIRPGLLNNTKIKVGTTETDVSNNTHVLRYQYTLSDAVILGATTGLGSVTTKTGTTETKESGMTDIIFQYAGFAPAEGNTWRWGADWGVSPGKNKTATGTTDGNLYSGGMSLTPYGAYEVSSPIFTWGVGASYALLMERTTEAATAGADDTKTTGGNTLTIKPYIETPITNGRVGGYLKYATVGETTSKTGSAASTTASKATTITGLGGAVAYGFTETFSGLAELEYDTLSSDGITGTELGLTIGGRATF